MGQDSFTAIVLTKWLKKHGLQGEFFLLFSSRPLVSKPFLSLALLPLSHSVLFFIHRSFWLTSRFYPGRKFSIGFEIWEFIVPKQFQLPQNLSCTHWSVQESFLVSAAGLTLPALHLWVSTGNVGVPLMSGPLDTPCLLCWYHVSFEISVVCLHPFINICIEVYDDVT